MEPLTGFPQKQLMQLKIGVAALACVARVIWLVRVLAALLTLCRTAAVLEKSRQARHAWKNVAVALEEARATQRALCLVYGASCLSTATRKAPRRALATGGAMMVAIIALAGSGLQLEHIYRARLALSAANGVLERAWSALRAG